MRIFRSLTRARQEIGLVRELHQLLKSQEKALKEQGKELAAIRRELAAVRLAQGAEEKWRHRFARKADALLRATYLDMAQDVEARRFQLRSQNEEDGIVLALLGDYGSPTRTFIDIGCGRKGGNSGVLALELGWAGMMIDASPVAIEQMKHTLAGKRRVSAICRQVTPETINEIVAPFPDPDFFSLDIDSFDYWVLAALESRPRVMCLEYNWLFGPQRPVTVPRDADLAAAPKGYHGASLAALSKLAAARGYGLVCCDPSGTNAFFVRSDLAPDLPIREAADAFRPGRSGDPAVLQGLPLVEV